MTTSLPKTALGRLGPGKRRIVEAILDSFVQNPGRFREGCTRFRWRPMRNPVCTHCVDHESPGIRLKVAWSPPHDLVVLLHTPPEDMPLRLLKKGLPAWTREYYRMVLSGQLP
jgi:hypothetical protein